MAETAVYTLEIDLDGDGEYEAGEDATGDVVPAGGGTGVLVDTDRGADGSTFIAPPKAGSLAVQLDNASGDYAPAALPAGRAIRLRATYDEETYDLWSGHIQRPRHVPDPAHSLVNVSAFGALAQLSGRLVSTALYQSITTDVALGHLLDAAGVDAPQDFDTGKTTLEWYWEPDDTDAFSALLALLFAEGPGAKIYEAPDGTIVFKNRTARAAEVRSTESQATYNGAGAEPLISFPYQYEDGLEGVYNAASVHVVKREVGSLGVVWQLGETVSLGPGESRSFVARPSGGDPIVAATTPQSGTDYTVSAGSLASVSLSRSSGPSVEITLTAGSGGATVAGLQLRATLAEVASEFDVSNSVDASASIAEFGRRPWQQQGRPEISAGTAQGMADAIVAWYRDGRPTVRVSLLANRGPEAMTEALTREISDRVTVVEGVSGVNGDFYVERVEHEIKAPSRHLVTYSLSAALGANYGIWDLSEWDGTDVWAW